LIERHPDFPNFLEVKHPLVQAKLSLLRDKQTYHKLFRELVNEITLLIGYEATTSLPLEIQTIETPLESCKVPLLKEPFPLIVPIMRAGLGMVEALLTLMPTARVGHLGLFRNEETLLPQDYYFKVPQDLSPEQPCFICDPMLATGGSAQQAVKKLKEKGMKNIVFLSILAAPEGVEKFSQAHPDVTIYSASLDNHLDSNGYIRPGVGDAGDRMYGTI
jgi:uracil phosphoribosyltransferase